MTFSGKRWGFKHGGFYTYRTHKQVLSNGQILVLQVHRYRGDRHASVAMAACRRFTWDPWKKQGTPTGPGGLEVWSRVAEVWDQVESVAYSLGAREVLVWGANERLTRIYARSLRPKGYVYDSYREEIWKAL